MGWRKWAEEGGGSGEMDKAESEREEELWGKREGPGRLLALLARGRRDRLLALWARGGRDRLQAIWICKVAL